MSWYRTAHPDWDVITGTVAEGPWCKAAAVADALSRTGADILVVTDADCLAPGAARAVQEIVSGRPWAVPHRLVHRLGQHATALVLDGADPQSIPLRRANYDQMPYPGVVGGGAVVLSRESYLDVPLDPGFTGWGQEDEAWGTALVSRYGPPLKGPEPLWHLWHPPQRRISRSTGSHASRALLHGYRTAARQKTMPAQLHRARSYLASLLAERTAAEEH